MRQGQIGSPLFATGQEQRFRNMPAMSVVPPTTEERGHGAFKQDQVEQKDIHGRGFGKNAPTTAARIKTQIGGMCANT